MVWGCISFSTFSSVRRRKYINPICDSFLWKQGKVSKFWCWAANNVTTHTAFIFLTWSLYLEMLQKFKLSSRICSICTCFLFLWECCVLLVVGILFASCLDIKDETHLGSLSIYEEIVLYSAKQVDKWSLHFQVAYRPIQNFRILLTSSTFDSKGLALIIYPAAVATPSNWKEVKFSTAMEALEDDDSSCHTVICSMSMYLCKFGWALMFIVVDYLQCSRCYIKYLKWKSTPYYVQLKFYNQSLILFRSLLALRLIWFRGWFASICSIVCDIGKWRVCMSSSWLMKSCLK